MKLYLHLSSYIKINLKLIKDLNLKSETLKPSKENAECTLLRYWGRQELF